MTPPTRDELIHLRENLGYTREDIADEYEVSVATVRRWIKDLEVPRPSRRGRPKRAKHLSSHGEIIARADDGYTTLERAKMILGGRLTEKRGVGYMLDGHPAHIDKIIGAAGLKSRG